MAALAREQPIAQRLRNPPLLNTIHEVPSAGGFPCPEEEPICVLLKSVKLCFHVFPHGPNHWLFPLGRVHIRLALATINVTSVARLSVTIWVGAYIRSSSPFSDIGGHDFVRCPKHVSPSTCFGCVLVLVKFLIRINEYLNYVSIEIVLRNVGIQT